MAGMEQLEIHSKSYLVRWVDVKAEHTISWSIRPEKKSINFGIFKHPGSGNAPTPRLPSLNYEPPLTPGPQSEDFPGDGASVHTTSSTATEKLKSIGLKAVQWCGTYESNRVNAGKYDVPPGEGGMYALVFDNTFSKQQSKKATFVLLTYPTKSPPQLNNHMHHIQKQGTTSTTSLKDTLGQKNRVALLSSSSDSVPQTNSLAGTETHSSDNTKDRSQRSNDLDPTSSFFTGMLQKRRRKKHQGWARRFFSLDYKTSTLSYYHDRNTLMLRGAIPLSLAAVGANGKTRQISIDSGAEIWHLKASTQKEFEAWKHALELAHAPVNSKSPPETRKNSLLRRPSAARTNPEDERDWQRVEELVGRVSASRKSAMSLAKDTDPKYLPSSFLTPSLERLQSDPVSTNSSNSGSPPEQGANGYFVENPSERWPFWKRKLSTERPMPGMFRRSVSATPPTMTPRRVTPPSTARIVPIAPEASGLKSHQEEGIHDDCMLLLKDLDAIVTDFESLLQESKARRNPLMHSSVSRHSIESLDEEFFDAEGFDSSQLLDIHHETDEEASERDYLSDGASSSDSEVEGPAPPAGQGIVAGRADPAYPGLPESLHPLPTGQVDRRAVVQPSTINPPSLISFLRKNVGKDLSTIAMPVSANEPLSLLQRFSEMLEYSTLLDTSCTISSSAERLIYVTAFAISQLSSSRIKERAIRKPFNPMLGETFELVREDRNFRFLSEKVSHRPVRLACQAHSKPWSLTQSPLPSQKFWGKSAELMTEGKVRIVLHNTGDRFNWTPATSFLRNIIAGEKYIEPVGTMVVANETTGEKAIVTFKSGGMFSGRSEDVIVQTYDSQGSETPLGMSGKWTTSFVVTENNTARQNGNPIWTATDLAPDAAQRYGFTTFTAPLNEITHNEKNKLPPTDSRLRPDQRAAEDGDLDTAEIMKAKLEEAQRQRRKKMEETGVEWQPKWFERVKARDGEEVWVEKMGKDGYWERRRRGDWEGVEKVFEV